MLFSLLIFNNIQDILGFADDVIVITVLSIFVVP